MNSCGNAREQGPIRLLYDLGYESLCREVADSSAGVAMGVISERVASLSDPDARPIRKGKPRSPTEFGHELLVAEDERGLVADHRLGELDPSRRSPPIREPW